MLNSYAPFFAVHMYLGCRSTTYAFEDEERWHRHYNYVFFANFFVLGLELILPTKFCNNINALISGKWYKSFYSLSPTFEFEYHYIIYIYCENNETCCTHLLQKLFSKLFRFYKKLVKLTLSRRAVCTRCDKNLKLP